jgi:hypothetical protein
MENKMDNLKNMIAAANDEAPNAFADALSSEMMDRIGAAIEQQRSEYADTIFAQELDVFDNGDLEHDEEIADQEEE